TRVEQPGKVDVGSLLRLRRVWSLNMTLRVIALAKQLLATVPQAEVTDLIRLLNYYNSNFKEEDRVRAMAMGGTRPSDPDLERVIVENMQKSAGSQNVYMSSSQDVCRCCGK